MKTFMFALFLLGCLCFCVMAVECGVAIGQDARDRYERALMRQARDQVVEVLLQQARETCARKGATP